VTPAGARVSVRPRAVETSVARFAEDVRYYLGLSPRQLPSRYLYDALGSALFDAICRLPWYGLARAETRLIDAHAREILAALHPLGRIVELGAGSGEKLARLIGPAAPAVAALEVRLIDVSSAALEAAARRVAALGPARVVLHEAPYEIGLEDVGAGGPASGRTLVLFLGSNIGNFDPPGAAALLRQIRAALGPGDACLVGADLVKPEAELVLAYDDPIGVTAAFNRNLLVRVNRELDAGFDPARFAHRAVWNREDSRVEMHLASTAAQRVEIRGAGLELTLDEGEIIWTESSYKYRPAELVGRLEEAGFRCRDLWIDAAARFALALLTVRELAPPPGP
jgi:dimethylhistidine N-methyltransferase